MRKLLTLTAAAALVAAFGFTGTAKAEVFFPFDTDLVAYWPFDDTTADDQAPADSNNDDGTFVSGATTTNSSLPPVVPNTNVLDVTTNGARVEVPDSSELNITGDITVAAWIKPAAFPQDDFAHLVFKGANSPFNVQYLLAYDPSGRKPRFLVADDVMQLGNLCQAIGDTDITANTWHHLVGTFDASTGDVKIYLDGVLDGSVLASPCNVIAGTIPNAEDLGIGSNANDGITSSQLDGLMDEVRIYDAALTGPQIATLHSSVAVFKELVDATEGTNVGDAGDLDLKEEWEFVMKVTVANNTSQDLTNASLRDPLPGDLELGDETSGTGASACPDDASVLLVDASGAPGKDVNTSPTTITRRNTDKCIIDWDIVSGAAGDDKLAPGDFVMLTITASTDVNPAGIRKGDAVTFQEYTSGTTHCINQGAELSGTLATVGSIVVQSNGLEVSIGDTLPDDVAFVTHDDCD